LRPLVDALQNWATVWQPSGQAALNGFQSRADLFVDPTGPLADLDKIIKGKIEDYRSELSLENCNLI
jgi:hypothetical protein